MLVIGLTGGIGTGKTEVAEALRGLGAEVVSADRLAHESYRRGARAWREIVDEFGDAVLAPGGEVDRGKLASIVFRDQAALERLNAIVHPRVREAIEERIGELRGRGEKAVVVEVPLLMEAVRQDARWTRLIDEIWATDAGKDQVLGRVRARDGLDAEAVTVRVNAQMARSERLAGADVVIDNRRGLRELRANVRRLWAERVSAE